MIFEKKMDFNERFKSVLLDKPHCILGKSGMTEEFVNHVITLLKRYKIIKVKALKSMATTSNMRDIAKHLSEQTNSHVIDLRGKTFILSKILIEKK